MLKGTERKRIYFFIGVILLAVLTVAGSLLTGTVPLDRGGVWREFFGWTGWVRAAPLEETGRIILWELRSPRLVAGFLVGAALATAGAVMQGLFRNPMADPGLVGVSAGASLGAVFGILAAGSSLGLMLVWLGRWSLPLCAFAGSLGVSWLIYRFARVEGRTVVFVMLLAGLALNAFVGSMVGLAVYLSADDQLRSITLWLLGSLAGSDWSSLSWAAPILGTSLLVLLWQGRSLNLLSLGEEEAGHLGVRVQSVKQWSITATAAGVGAAVALTGIISFVGLLVPHLVRMAIGPDHRFLLPGSALLGAVLLAACDLLARSLVAPAELPIGILTSLAGAPFFLFLLWQMKHRMTL